MTTTQLTNERRKELIEAYGFTDGQMKEVMRARGFKDLDNEVVLAECCVNLGYKWSFRLKRWFDKNPVGLGDDQLDHDTLLSEIKEEAEHK